jgi:hypothetical protein
MGPESPSPYPQMPATCPYPEPTPSSPHDSLQLYITKTIYYKITIYVQSLQNCDNHKAVIHIK